MHFSGLTHLQRPEPNLWRKIYQMLSCQLKIKIPENKQPLLKKAFTWRLHANDEALTVVDTLSVIVAMVTAESPVWYRKTTETPENLRHLLLNKTKQTDDLSHDIYYEGNKRQGSLPHYSETPRKRLQAYVSLEGNWDPKRVKYQNHFFHVWWDMKKTGGK